MHMYIRIDIQGRIPICGLHNWWAHYVKSERILENGTTLLGIWSHDSFDDEKKKTFLKALLN